MAMRHRGPDAQAAEGYGAAALGHARLSIIDLDRRANQPMRDGDDRYVIVFNGEIYNFHDIRCELEERGARFRTQSDTEIILEAYKAWGVDCLSRFNGMFAFALWDRDRRELFLARDRFGKKPLYYFRTGDGGIAFASELKALRRHPDCPRSVDPGAVRQYLALNYTLTSRCILAGVEKLPPAHWLMVRPGGEDGPVRYWDYAAAFRTKARYRDEGEAVDALDALLSDAVRLRMISDVPLGAFLSGGVDSATVTALMRRHAAGTVNTYSIGFREAAFDESPFARRVATHLGLAHHDQMVDEEHWQLFPQLAGIADEPFADTSLLPTWELSRYAREGVTVCLSGDGGDEIFGGYETYAADRLFQWLRWVPPALPPMAAALADRLLPAASGKVSPAEKARRFLGGLGHGFRRAHYSWRIIFRDEELRGLLHPDLAGLVGDADPFEDFAGFFAEAGDLHYLDQAMYVDAKTWLPDDILVKVDRASMAHGLEVRAPLLDYRLAEFAASLPVEMKIRGLKKKYILLKEHARYLPAVLTPPKKLGFNAPVSQWMSGQFKDFSREALRHPAMAPWVRPGHVDQIWDEHLSGRLDNGLKLLGLLGLSLWLQADIAPVMSDSEEV